jgi:hypothetical protein
MAHGALVALQKIIIDIGVQATRKWEHYTQYESLMLKYFNDSLGALPDLVSTRFEDACTTYQPFFIYHLTATLCSNTLLTYRWVRILCKRNKCF